MSSKKKTGMSQTLISVISFCKAKPENKAALATALNYTTATTISAWIKKKKIPGFREADIKAALAKLRA